MSDLLPVRWLCGPSGVGKSTAGWELFSGLPGAGYVDIDQIGMCYPELACDPGRTVLEGRILSHLVANFAAAGARGLVVSGYIDFHRGIHTEYLPHAALSVLRLRCDRPELRRRLQVRGRHGEDLDEILREADEIDGNGLPYPCLDTTGRTAAQVLATVRERWSSFPARPPSPWPDPRPAPPGEIVWVCGPPAVGKSTVGYEVAQSSLRAGRTTGFVDLQQIGFLSQDRDNHRLKAANLAGVWREFHAHGARWLVVVGGVGGPEQVRRYADALPGVGLTLCRLHAGPDQLRERIRLRGIGGGPDLAGDALRGQPAAVLDRACDAAISRAESLDQVGLGDVRVDTDGRTVDDLAREIVARVGW